MLLVAALCVIGAAAIAFGPGTYDVYSRTVVPTEAQLRQAPPWTLTCWKGPHLTKHTDCVHVEGRVAWIQRHDPDGDGDRHVIVVVHLHPRIVKIGRELAVAKLPRIGSRVEATGFLTVSAGGHQEVDAMAFKPSDASGGRSSDNDPRQLGGLAPPFALSSSGASPVAPTMGRRSKSLHLHRGPDLPTTGMEAPPSTSFPPGL